MQSAKFNMNFAKIDQKMAIIGKELDKDPNNPEVWAAKADLLCSIGMYENAVRCCDRSLEIDPDNAFTWATKSNALDNLGRKDEAKTAFVKAKALGYTRESNSY